MPTKKLTDLFVGRALAPVGGRVEYFDASFPGLALRVTENGRKSWSLFYRFHGRLRRFTIGRYPAIKPSQARREAITALERVRQGIDPAEEKRARRDKPSPEAETFESLVQDYLERHVRKNSATVTYQEAKRDLEYNVLPKWRNRPIASISRHDAIDLIDGLVERGVEIQANRTLARLRALFNWAIEKDRISGSPVNHMKPPTKERARDRAHDSHDRAHRAGVWRGRVRRDRVRRDDDRAGVRPCTAYSGDDKRYTITLITLSRHHGPGFQFCVKYRRSGGGWFFLVGIRWPSALRK